MTQSPDDPITFTRAEIAELCSTLAQRDPVIAFLAKRLTEAPQASEPSAEAPAP